MLDRKFILDNVSLVKQNCLNRNVTADIDRLVSLEGERKAKLQQVQDLNTAANTTSKSIGQAADPRQRESLKEQGRMLREQKERAQQEHDALESEIIRLQAALPNIAHPDTPIGKDEESNREIFSSERRPRDFDFKPLDHLELGELQGWIDFEAGARTTGNGFYFLMGELVLLDLALQQYAIQQLAQRGFTLAITPDLARDSILEGIGFMPRGPETQTYSIADSDISLIGTAEITLGGMYSGKTLNYNQLPIRLAGISHCYRTEAGAAGRASRGLYRVHQFTKVEMFAFCLPEHSDQIHAEFREIECQLFDAIEVPYRVVDIATGDLGGPAYRKFDLEAWMPGRGTAGEWGEVTSTSNCTDYQARRLNIRFKERDKKGTQFVHTLNGTAFALSRALIAVLENHQNSDGTVNIPVALRPILGKDNIGQPVRS
jgi:seryl-tRNA synthetase